MQKSKANCTAHARQILTYACKRKTNTISYLYESTKNAKIKIVEKRRKSKECVNNKFKQRMNLVCKRKNKCEIIKINNKTKKNQKTKIYCNK